MTDLNKQNLMDDSNEFTIAQEDNSIYDANGSNISVYFKDLEGKLINHIDEADVVVGCVAWLTNFKILDHLAKKQVSIIVQKEDFLRPDNILDTSTFKKILMEKYNNLHMDIYRYNLIGCVSMCSYPDMQPVRCMGNHNSDKSPAFPRMHNKFVIFCKTGVIADDGSEYDDNIGLSPYAVWTGSYNFSKNSGNSLENALYITDQEVVNAYFLEYMQIATLSEQLDWEVPWCDPEWRIGT